MHHFHIHQSIDWPAWITALATAVGALLASLGLSAWKKQLKGKNDWELARRYLKAVYKMRNALSYVRNPWVPIGEMTAAMKAMGYTEEEHSDRRKVNGATYSQRWEKVKEASADLDIEALEAEVSWGTEAVGLIDELYRLRGRLLININYLIDDDKDIRPDRDILYEHESKDDKFSGELKGVVAKIENYLKPHLK